MQILLKNYNFTLLTDYRRFCPCLNVLTAEHRRQWWVKSDILIEELRCRKLEPV